MCVQQKTYQHTLTHQIMPEHTFQVVPGPSRKERILYHPFIENPVSFFSPREIQETGWDDSTSGSSALFTFEMKTFNGSCTEYWGIPRKLKSRTDLLEREKLVQYRIFLEYRKTNDEMKAYALTLKHCQPTHEITHDFENYFAMYVFHVQFKRIQLSKKHFALTGVSSFMFVFFCLFFIFLCVFFAT